MSTCGRGLWRMGSSGKKNGQRRVRICAIRCAGQERTHRRTTPTRSGRRPARKETTWRSRRSPGWTISAACRSSGRSLERPRGFPPRPRTEMSCRSGASTAGPLCRWRTPTAIPGRMRSCLTSISGRSADAIQSPWKRGGSGIRSSIFWQESSQIKKISKRSPGDSC